MLATQHRRCRLEPKSFSAALVLLIVHAFCGAQIAGSNPSCTADVQTLKDSASFSLLAKDEQAKVLGALSDDIAEMAEIDVAASQTSRAAYRNYFISHLQFKAVTEPRPAEQLLMIRYDSNTMCGSYENCPVWIVRLTRLGAHARAQIRAQTMVPWQDENLGTSAGGSWAVGLLPTAASDYPELLFLTHLSSLQTALACYRESKGHYLRVDCSPGCVDLLKRRGDEGDGQ